jgi:hypothetical protein
MQGGIGGQRKIQQWQMRVVSIKFLGVIQTTNSEDVSLIERE